MGNINKQPENQRKYRIKKKMKLQVEGGMAFAFTPNRFASLGIIHIKPFGLCVQFSGIYEV